ncbi:hypothetical protein N7501_011030 [Penicillium viridicatum]|nr:hypothetical protein N7501_011030 [Penicillium viridicatum]
MSMHAHTSPTRPTTTHNKCIISGLQTIPIPVCRLGLGRRDFPPRLFVDDIGATEANITATRLNFEFFGGVLALRVLQNDTHEDEDEANMAASPFGVYVRAGVDALKIQA